MALEPIITSLFLTSYNQQQYDGYILLSEDSSRFWMLCSRTPEGYNTNTSICKLRGTPIHVILIPFEENRKLDCSAVARIR